jgi:hypothetical protein
MHITLQEGSEFFRGLLLLIRKDQKITDEEKSLLMRIGKSLGFAPSFCTTAIAEILENKYVSTNPPVFSDKKIAENFINHGLIISFSDNEIHRNELQWLQLVANSNGIDNAWVQQEKEKLILAHNKKKKDFDDLIRLHPLS